MPRKGRRAGIQGQGIWPWAGQRFREIQARVGTTESGSFRTLPPVQDPGPW